MTGYRTSKVSQQEFMRHIDEEIERRRQFEEKRKKECVKAEKEREKE